MRVVRSELRRYLCLSVEWITMNNSVHKPSYAVTAEAIKGGVLTQGNSVVLRQELHHGVVQFLTAHLLCVPVPGLWVAILKTHAECRVVLLFYGDALDFRHLCGSRKSSARLEDIPYRRECRSMPTHNSWKATLCTSKTST